MNALFCLLLFLITIVSKASCATVSIVYPEAGQTIPAGTFYFVELSYSNGAEEVDSTVTLKCGGNTEASGGSSTPTVGIQIPEYIYGDCTFSVSAAGYSSGSNVDVVITQQLSFTSPASGAVIDIDNSIPIKLATAGNTAISTEINLQLTCTNGFSEYLPVAVTTNTASAYDYAYSASAYGPCTLGVISTPSYLVPPSALSFTLKYVLTITPPTAIYIGQTFSVTLNCAQTPGVSTTTLYLYQSGLLKETYLNVEINSDAPIPLVAPTNLVSGTDCELKTAADSSFFKQVTESGITVSNVQLRFSSPSSSSTYPISSIPILIDSADVTSLQPVTLTPQLFCGTDVNPVDTISVTAGVSLNYNNPNSGLGSCTLKYTSSIAYLLSPADVSFTIQPTITVTVTNDVIAAGSTITLTLVYNPSSPTPGSYSISLKCSDDLVETVTDPATLSFAVPADFYGSSCVFFASATDYYSYDTTVTITQPLSFTSPSASSVININSPIPIQLVTTGNTTITEIIDLQLNCDNGYSYDLNDTVTTNSAYNYAYSASAYGPCTLGVISAPSYLVPPSDVSLTLKYVLTITPPSTIYIGQPFTVTLGCAQTPGVSATTLYLYQLSQLMSTYENVDINSIETLVAPTNLTAGTSCTLQTAADDDVFKQVISSAISVSTVQLRFAKPTLSTYAYTETIPILVNSASVTNIQPVTVSVTLTCSSVTIETFDVVTGEQTDYSNINNAFGPCSLSVTVPGTASYLIAPAAYDFTITGVIEILTPVTSPLVYVAAGNSLSITLNYLPAQTPSVSSTATLSCPGFDPITATINLASGTLGVLSDYYGNPCTLTVSSTYYTQDTVDVAVTQQLSFASPSASSVININSPITIRLATTGNTTINEIIDLQLNCDNGYSYDLNDTVATNSAYDYAYSASAYGPCTLGVISAPSYLVPPSDVSFTLKYVLTITPPSTIYIGQTFTVTLSCAQTPGVSATTLYLYQSGLLMSTYENVDINSIETLVAPTNLTAGTSCTLQTAADDDVFKQVISSAISVSTVQLRFASPATSSSYSYAATIPILINSATVPSITPATITVQLTCSSVAVHTFTVTTDVTFNYNNPNNGVGPCVLSATTPYSYLIAPSSVSFSITGTVGMSSSQTAVAAGQSLPISLTYTPHALPSPSASLVLNCPGVGTSTGSISGGTSGNLNIPDNFYGDACTVSVTATYFSTLNSINVMVTQILSFDTPTNSSLPQLPNPLPVNMTSVETGASIELGFECDSGPSDVFNVTAAVEISYTYPTNSYGPCSLSVLRAPAYYILPYSVFFNLKYLISFDQLPSYIYIGQNFTTKIVSSTPSLVSTLNLSLVCVQPDSSLAVVDYWEDTKINQLVTLVASSTLSANANCYLQGPSNSNYFFPVTSSQATPVSTFSLRFSEPSSTDFVHPDPIPIYIDSAQVPDVYQDVQVTLACSTAGTSNTFPYQTMNDYEYDYVDAAYGNCTLSVNTGATYISPPTPITVSIQYSLSFNASTPSTLYIGQEFNFTINSSAPVPAAIQYISMNLICPSGLVDNWGNIELNKQMTRTLISTASVASGCTLQTVANNDIFIGATSNPISVAKSDLIFVLPSQNDTTIEAPNQLQFKLQVEQFPEVEVDAQVEFICETMAAPEVIDTTASQISSYTYDKLTYGYCNLTISNAPVYYNIGPSVDFYIKYALEIVEAPTLMFIGESFSIQINSSDILPSNLLSVPLSLYCGATLEQTWPTVTLNEVQSLLLTDEPVSSGSCQFVTQGTTNYFVNTTVSVSVSNSGTMQLNFTAPSDEPIVLIPQPVDIFLEVVGLPTLVRTVTAQIQCQESGTSQLFSLDTSTSVSFSAYTTNLYGNCSLSVYNAASYFILPTPVYFSLNYFLEFTTAPATIFIGQNFDVFISSSSLTTLSLTTGLSLICGGSVKQTWNNVELDNVVTLFASGNLLPESSCTLETPTASKIFTHASAPTQISFIPSPFGGTLYPITQEQVTQFLNEIRGVPGNW